MQSFLPRRSSDYTILKLATTGESACFRAMIAAKFFLLSRCGEAVLLQEPQVLL